MILQVRIGVNLNYTFGRLHYLSGTDTNPTASDTSEIAIITFAAIVIVMVLIIILLVLVIGFVVKNKSKKNPSVAFTGNTDVNMYASPAYGSHQVFTEPGLDHLYEPIDELYEEETTKLQDAASPANDNESDIENYFKMNPSFQVVDQGNEGNEHDTGSHSGSSDDVQAADDEDHMPANGNDEDDGYENDDQQKNDYLQLKTDQEDTS